MTGEQWIQFLAMAVILVIVLEALKHGAIHAYHLWKVRKIIREYRRKHGRPGG